MRVEFQRSPWLNVPLPALDDASDASLTFSSSRDPRRDVLAYRTPHAAITPDTDGDVGYEFHVSAGLGNLTLYAIAGVEDREVDPPRFTAYVMGLVHGVSENRAKTRTRSTFRSTYRSTTP